MMVVISFPDCLLLKALVSFSCLQAESTWKSGCPEAWAGISVCLLKCC